MCEVVSRDGDLSESRSRVLGEVNRFYALYEFVERAKKKAYDDCLDINLLLSDLDGFAERLEDGDETALADSRRWATEKAEWLLERGL